jgi:hypothetical protein
MTVRHRLLHLTDVRLLLLRLDPHHRLPLRLAPLLISSSLLCMPEPGIDSMGIYHIMPNMFLYIKNIWLCPTGFNRFHRYTFGQFIMVNMIQQTSTYICHIPTWNPKSIWSVDSIYINISNVWYIQIQLISKYHLYPYRFQHSIKTTVIYLVSFYSTIYPYGSSRGFWGSTAGHGSIGMIMGIPGNPTKNLPWVFQIFLFVYPRGNGYISIIGLWQFCFNCSYYTYIQLIS